MEEKRRRELKREANKLRSEMRKLGQIIMGSMNFRKIKCGKTNCKCARGELHECWCITYKEKGKTRTISIDKNKVGEALMMRRSYKKMKKLIKELSLVNYELVRSRRKTKDGNEKKRKGD